MNWDKNVHDLLDKTISITKEFVMSTKPATTTVTNDLFCEPISTG